MPVTKAWLRQLVLGLVLIGQLAARRRRTLADSFDYPISLGTVFNIVHAAVTPARQCKSTLKTSAMSA